MKQCEFDSENTEFQVQKLFYDKNSSDLNKRYISIKRMSDGIDPLKYAHIFNRKHLTFTTKKLKANRAIGKH